MNKKFDWGGLFLRIVVFLLILFILAPLVVIIGASFTSTSYLSFPPEQFSLKWYKNYFGDSSWMAATRVSVQMAIVSTIFNWMR